MSKFHFTLEEITKLKKRYEEYIKDDKYIKSRLDFLYRDFIKHRFEVKQFKITIFQNETEILHYDDCVIPYVSKENRLYFTRQNIQYSISLTNKTVTILDKNERKYSIDCFKDKN